MFSTFRTTAMGAAALALAQFASPAQAAYVVSLQQVGTNVVGTGSGSLDTTDLLSKPDSSVTAPFINPQNADLYLGSGTAVPYGVVSGPTSFGSGSPNFSGSGSGNVAGIFAASVSVLAPANYVSGTPLGTSTITFNSTSLAALGVIDGTYTWTWGTGAHADSLTLQIGPVATTPEPASLALLAVGLAGLGMVVRTRRA
jgi:hypothetical protein